MQRNEDSTAEVRRHVILLAVERFHEEKNFVSWRIASILESMMVWGEVSEGVIVHPPKNVQSLYLIMTFYLDLQPRLHLTSSTFSPASFSTIVPSVESTMFHCSGESQVSSIGRIATASAKKTTVERCGKLFDDLPQSTSLMAYPHLLLYRLARHCSPSPSPSRPLSTTPKRGKNDAYPAVSSEGFTCHYHGALRVVFGAANALSSPTNRVGPESAASSARCEMGRSDEDGVEGTREPRWFVALADPRAGMASPCTLTVTMMDMDDVGSAWLPPDIFHVSTIRLNTWCSMSYDGTLEALKWTMLGKVNCRILSVTWCCADE